MILSSKNGILISLFTGILVTSTVLTFTQDKERSEREKLYFRYWNFNVFLRGNRIEPHWMSDGNSFWYALGPTENTKIYKVDPLADTTHEFFDQERLKKALEPIFPHQPDRKGLPFKDFIFLEDENAVEFHLEDKDFTMDLETYEIAEAEKPSVREKRMWRTSGIPSPDSRWIAYGKDHNLWLRSTSSGEEVQITTDGIEDYDWKPWWNGRWSPDSTKFVLLKQDAREVPRLPIVQWLGPKEEVKWTWYVRPGYPVNVGELYIIDVASKKPFQIDLPEPLYYGAEIFGWSLDGAELYFCRRNRESNRLDLQAFCPETDSIRTLFTETSQRIISDQPRDHYGVKGKFAFLPDGKRFIYAKETEGWNHLSLYDTQGRFLKQLTKGEFEVVRIVAVDETTGWVYFTACGVLPRPYDRHLYRVDFDGEGFTRLTEAPANHDSDAWLTRVPNEMTRFSPSKKFFLDTYSAVDKPLVTELRKADGSLVRTLFRMDTTVLEEELMWTPPEEFKVKAADGITDLYGVLFKPYDFDPKKKYPVIEVIYNNEAVPRTLTLNMFALTAQALASQGFIVFMVDGRGTACRGQTFREAFIKWKYLETITDHVATLKQLGEDRSYIDLERVGIYGYSGGGPQVLKAMFHVPGIYHVGVVAATGPVDAYGVPAPYVEAILGSPKDNPEGYENFSLLPLAKNLEGKLLLIHGTSDDVAPFSHVMKVADALIKAGKEFDMLVLPEVNHYFSRGPEYRDYFHRTVLRYFVEHLKPDTGK
jgi:dipeptidyl aminopeptidase/acylaminoacyl peptidase